MLPFLLLDGFKLLKTFNASTRTGQHKECFKCALKISTWRLLKEFRSLNLGRVVLAKSCPSLAALPSNMIDRKKAAFVFYGISFCMRQQSASPKVFAQKEQPGNLPKFCF